MLLSLSLRIILIGVTFSAATRAMDIKSSIEGMQKEASKEKSDVEQIIHTMTGALQNETHSPKQDLNQTESATNLLKQGGSCSTGGCASFRETQLFERNTTESSLMATGKPLIFVSSSMPIASLKLLAHQAKIKGATLVIRGMVKGSMRETATLVDQIDHPLEIDPKLFERFGVKQVPVFLVKHQTSWHKVSGNVELNFALESVNKDRLGHTTTGE